MGVVGKGAIDPGLVGEGVVDVCPPKKTLLVLALIVPTSRLTVGWRQAGDRTRPTFFISVKGFLAEAGAFLTLVFGLGGDLALVSGGCL